MRQPALIYLFLILAAALTENAAKAQQVLKVSPPYKARPLRDLAASLVARRDKALKDAKTPKVVLGYSPMATIKVPKGAKDAYPYFVQASELIAAKKGGVLRVEAGTYLLSNQFEIMSSNTHVVGAGIDKTIIKLVDKAPLWEQCGLLYARGVEYISITDMTYDGNKDKQDPDPKTHFGKYGNYMDQYKDVLFQRVKVANFLRYGFDPHGYSKKFWSDGLVVLDCISKNNLWDGFTFDQTYNIYARNNSAINNGRHGFNIITGARNVLVEKNVANTNGFGDPVVSHSGNGCAFMVDNMIYHLGTRDVIVQDNSVDGAKRAAFCTQEARSTSFLRNKANNAGSCINLRSNSTKITFANNTCTKVKQPISFWESNPKELTAVGNVFK